MEDKKQKKPSGSLAKRWTQLDTARSSMIRRCEEYAMWTLPYLFPPTGSKNTELQGPLSSTGARAVNFLSNKLVMTLFSQQFFRLSVQVEAMQKLVDAAREGDKEATELLATLDKELIAQEKAAIQALGYNRFRTEATTAAKSVVVLGNSMLYLPEDGNTQVYGLRDYCVVRDLSGNVIEFIMRDQKALSTFSPAIIEKLRESNKNKYKDEAANVTLYTCVKFNEDGRFHMKQEIEQVPLDSKGIWPKEDLPWIILTWNLIRGEDYGRGLVEDYAGTFHALYELNKALITGVAIASEVKFLVDPTSMLDVKEMNDSPSGSYHSGKEGDVSCVQLNKSLDFGMVEKAVDRLTRDIAQAFLLNSSVPRDAERVTAEEIRYVAQELETAHGGVYSRFAEEWQYRVAVLILKRNGMKPNERIRPQILTGLENLSRSGDLDNFRMFMSDLSMLNNVPEEFRAALNPRKLAAFLGNRAGVDYDQFTFTDAEITERQNREQEAINQQLAQQGQNEVAVEAGKEAVKGQRQ